MEKEFKKVFISDDRISFRLLCDYITNDLGFLPIRWQLKDKEHTLFVPENCYEQLLVEGQKFVVEKQLPLISWLDYYDMPGKCGNLKLAQASLGTITSNKSWDDMENLPKDVLKYLKYMSEYLKTKISSKYNYNDNVIHIESESLNYDEQNLLLKDFISKEGCWPFESINLKSISGEKLEKQNSVLMKRMPSSSYKENHY